jgi:hypothetical protein
MDRNVQGKYQLLITKICNGEKLSDNERDWLFAHPIESSTYKNPWIIVKGQGIK